MSRKRGFTLIELLVVVAIIALLIAILLPSLARVRETTKKTICATNLKAQGTGFAIYAAGNSDYLPVQGTLGNANWLWDQPVSTSDTLANLVPGTRTATRDTSVRKLFYCPTNPSQNDNGLWNYAGSSVLGYGYLNDRGSGPFTTANNSNLPPRTPAITFKKKYSGNNGSFSELAFDALLSDAGQVNAQNVNKWTAQGGWGLHQSSHMKRTSPEGANVLALDNSVSWRQFVASGPKFTQGIGSNGTLGSQPYFFLPRP